MIAPFRAQAFDRTLRPRNILFGGIIGAGVDVSTGAAYDYPSLITVPMVAAPMAPPAAAPLS